LALHRVRAGGADVAELVTFAPKAARFKAHPLSVMALQAETLGLPHRVIEIAEPFREGYRAAIAALADAGVGTLITGDIDLVAGLPNWIIECCAGLPVQTLMPLWHADRRALLGELVAAGFEVILSCVKRPWFTGDWLETRIDRAGIARLERLRVENGVDLCGENGEYHTLVLNGPGFGRGIEITDWSPRADGDIMYMDVRAAALGGA
jgi:uncharacterized protein (TIGR00290 family)